MYYYVVHASVQSFYIMTSRWRADRVLRWCGSNLIKFTEGAFFSYIVFKCFLILCVSQRNTSRMVTVSFRFHTNHKYRCLILSHVNMHVCCLIHPDFRFRSAII